MPSLYNKALNRTSLMTGEAKSIPLNALPEEAWTVIGDKGRKKGSKEHLRKTVATLHRCIDIRADSVSIVPWSITTTSGDDVWTSTDDGEMPEQIAWANDIEKLINLTEQSLCISSTAYWHIQRNMLGSPLELRWLAPRTMTPIWDNDSRIKHFERRLSEFEKRPLKLENVLYFWDQDPNEETHPNSSPLDAALAGAGVLGNMDAFIEQFFARGAIKATLLTVEGNPMQEEKDRLREWWRRAFTGVKNAFNSEVFNAEGVKPVVIGDGLSELSNKTLTNEKREAIAIAFGIPMSMLFSNAANYATAGQDKRNFYDETIKPELRAIATVMNNTLFSPLDLRFSFNPDAMDIYQTDENKRAEAYTAYVASGMMPSYAAQMLGLKLPQGVEYEDLDKNIILRPQGITHDGNPSTDAFPTKEENDERQQKQQKKQQQQQQQAKKNIDGGDDGSARDDLRKWQKKALAGYRYNKKASVPFESLAISAEHHERITEALAVAQSQEEVKAAFLAVRFLDAPNFKTLIASDMLAKLSTSKAVKLAALHEVLKADLHLSSLDPDDEESSAERKAMAEVEGEAHRSLEKALGSSVNDILSKSDGTPLGAPDDTVEDVDTVRLSTAPARAASVTKKLASEALTEALLSAADLGASMAAEQVGSSVAAGFDWTKANQAAADWAAAHAAETIDEIAATSADAVRLHISRWIEGEGGATLADLVQSLEPWFGSNRASLIATTEVTRAFAEANEIAYATTGVVAMKMWKTANDEKVCTICGPLIDIQAPLGDAFTADFNNPPAHPRCRCIINPVVDRDLIAKEVGGGGE